MNSQDSTQDQLAELKILAIGQEYDVDDLSERCAKSIQQIATRYGLYDAADFVGSRIESGKLKGLFD